MFKNFFKFIIAAILISIPIYIYAQTASILPPAETQFFDANGNPLSGGTVDFYIPNTFTRKTTWQDAAETIPNTNPVVLDAAGKALIYGSGSYRQVLKDSSANLIWDQVTTAPLPSTGATLTGDGNAVGTIKPYVGLIAPAQYLFSNGQQVSRTTYSALLSVMTQVNIVNCVNASPIINGISDTTQIPIGAIVELSCVPGGTTVISTTSNSVTLSANATANGNFTATFFPFGDGNGTTTFTLPDMRGVVLAGRNNMGGSAGAKLSTTYFAANPNALGVNGGSQSHVMTVSELVAHNHTAASVVTDPGHTHSVAVVASGNNYAAGGVAAAVAGSGTSGANTTGITVTTTTSNNGTGTAFPIVPPSMTVNYVIKVLPDISISSSNVVTSLGAQTGDITCGTNLTCSGNSINAVTTGGGTVASGGINQFGYYSAGGTTISGLAPTSAGPPKLKIGFPVSVLDYGADATGTVDSTTAFAAAITASNQVTIPCGTFKINLNTSATNLDLGGAGFCTQLQPNSFSSPVITLSANANFNRLHDFYVVGPGTAVGSSSGIVMTGAANKIHHVVVQYFNQFGIECIGSNLSGNDIVDSLIDYAGVYAVAWSGCNDSLLKGNSFGSLVSPFNVGGLYLLNSSANMITGNFIWQNGVDIIIDGTSALNIIDHNRISQSQFQGILCYTCANTIISNNEFYDNNVSGSSFSHIELQIASKMIINNNRMFKFNTSNTQYGVNITSGTSTFITVIGNQLFDNNTAGLRNVSTQANLVIKDNAGYNPVGISTAVTMGASPVTITAGPTPETHYVNQSATNTATCTKGSQQIARLNSTAIYYPIELAPNESYICTWSATAPTYTKDVH